MNPADGTIVVWPFVAYFGVVLVVVGGMMGLSYVLGERHKRPGISTNIPFESGILPTGSARIRIPVQFYLVAIFFVVFDMETAFILAWAIGFRELGWTGYIEILVFIGVLLAVLGYLWRVGALDWSPDKRRVSPPEQLISVIPENPSNPS